MKIIALAVCLLFCFHPARHHPHHRAMISCDTIELAYNEFLATSTDQGHDGFRDQFVKTYPAVKQHHVLECIGDR